MKDRTPIQLAASFDGLCEDFCLVDIDPADCPIFLAAAVPRRPGLTGLKPRLPSGRGFTRAQAHQSAAGEAVEMIASLADRPGGPRQTVIQDGLAHVEARHVLTGERRLVPAQAVFLDFGQVHGEPIEIEADSGGCAAVRQ